MERSESKTNSKVSSRIQGNDLSTQIKPYYRVHAGESGNNATEQPMEAMLSHADALLQRERQSYTEPMLSIVIPTYNSQRWISTLLDTLLALQAEKEILIIDDGSTDATVSLIQSFREKYPEVTLLQHDAHRGQSAALQTGLAASFGKVIVVVDGITDIKNKDVVMLVKPILAGCCDVVYGSHHILSCPEQETGWVRAIDRLLTGFLNLSTGQHLSHTGSPMKAFRRTALDAISSEKTRQATDIEMIFQLSKKGRRIYEMPLDSTTGEKSSGRFLWRQAVTAIQLLRHAVRF